MFETKSKLYTNLLLIYRFELISQTNTNNKVETCGILCGVLRDGDTGESLLITHLVVPKQKGGPDSCETLNEQDLFEFQVIPHVKSTYIILVVVHNVCFAGATFVPGIFVPALENDIITFCLINIKQNLIMSFPKGHSGTKIWTHLDHIKCL